MHVASPLYILGGGYRFDLARQGVRLVLSDLASFAHLLGKPFSCGLYVKSLFCQFGLSFLPQRHAVCARIATGFRRQPRQPIP